jgi:hypothetical protein
MFINLKKKVFLIRVCKFLSYNSANVSLRNNYLKKDDLLKKIMYISYFKNFKYKSLTISFNTKNFNFNFMDKGDTFLDNLKIKINLILFLYTSNLSYIKFFTTSSKDSFLNLKGDYTLSSYINKKNIDFFFFDINLNKFYFTSFNFFYKEKKYNYFTFKANLLDSSSLFFQDLIKDINLNKMFINLFIK